jgi:hypothetical protein
MRSILLTCLLVFLFCGCSASTEKNPQVSVGKAIPAKVVSVGKVFSQANLTLFQISYDDGQLRNVFSAEKLSVGQNVNLFHVTCEASRTSIESYFIVVPLNEDDQKSTDEFLKE